MCCSRTRRPYHTPPPRRSSPWDSADGTRAILVRNIPNAFARAEVVVAWCSNYGTVAAVRLAAADACPTTAALGHVFAVVQYFDQRSAVAAVQDLARSVGATFPATRLHVVPFPVIHPVGAAFASSGKTDGTVYADPALTADPSVCSSAIVVISVTEEGARDMVQFCPRGAEDGALCRR